MPGHAAWSGLSPATLTLLAVLIQPPIPLILKFLGSLKDWTINSTVALWGQSSFGTIAATPSLLSNLGFAVAF